MGRGPSQKIMGRTNKLFRIMSCEAWLGVRLTTVGWLHQYNGRHPINPLTSPQLRRCLDALLAQGRVRRHGMGRMGWWAPSIEERHRARAVDIEATNADQRLRKMEALGMRNLGHLHHYNRMSSFFLIIRSQAVLDGLMALIENEPEIANRYFDLRPPEDTARES